MLYKQTRRVKVRLFLIKNYDDIVKEFISTYSLSDYDYLEDYIDKFGDVIYDKVFVYIRDYEFKNIPIEQRSADLELELYEAITECDVDIIDSYIDKFKEMIL